MLEAVGQGGHEVAVQGRCSGVEMPSLPGKRGSPKAAARHLTFGSKSNQKQLTEEMKRGSKQWKRVVEGMKSESVACCVPHLRTTG